MQLKLLIVPSLVIISLIIGIGFIKPDYDSLTEKKALLAQKNTEAMNIQSIQSAIESLTQSLRDNEEKEVFVRRYYPETLDQERVIDAVNYLASQSGVILVGLQLEEGTDEPAAALEPLPQETAGLIPGDIASSEALLASAQPVYEIPRPKTYVAKVSARGTYENLRAFIDRVSHMDRISEVSFFSYKNEEKKSSTPQDGEETSADQDSELEASIEAQFSYLPQQTGFNALHVPIFRKTSLDFAPAEEAKIWAASVVPPLAAGTAGKANPFR